MVRRFVFAVGVGVASLSVPFGLAWAGDVHHPICAGLVKDIAPGVGTPVAGFVFVKAGPDHVPVGFQLAGYVAGSPNGHDVSHVDVCPGKSTTTTEVPPSTTSTIPEQPTTTATVATTTTAADTTSTSTPVTSSTPSTTSPANTSTSTPTSTTDSTSTTSAAPSSTSSQPTSTTSPRDPSVPPVQPPNDSPPASPPVLPATGNGLGIYLAASGWLFVLAGLGIVAAVRRDRGVR